MAILKQKLTESERMVDIMKNSNRELNATIVSHITVFVLASSPGSPINVEKIGEPGDEARLVWSLNALYL